MQSKKLRRNKVPINKLPLAIRVEFRFLVPAGSRTELGQELVDHVANLFAQLCLPMFG